MTTDHEEYERALTEAMARHSYSPETQPPDAPPRCPHCRSESLYATSGQRVLCNNCGRSYNESDLK